MIKGVKTKIVKKSNNLYRQFFRYIIVGLLGFLVDIGLLYILTEKGIYYLLAASVAFLFGLLVNYLLCLVWIFDRKNKSSMVTEFTYLIIFGLLIMALNVGLMWVLTDIFKLYYLSSKMIATIILFTLNFYVRKYIIFND
ncbi:MAG: GtrA family protein [Bacilli bacterium]|jgi:putative flippase GtrA